MFKTLLITLIFFSGAVTLCATENKITEDIDFILKIRNTSRPHENSIKNCRPKAISETGFVSAGVIRIYRVLLSSQDRESCNFDPSCSRFAEAAVKEFGFFKGILLTTDRLSRCHVMARPQQCIRNDTCTAIHQHKIYDPPGQYISDLNDD